ncbi:Vms1/Ankzf1 family peptidyl-tRNA hydrolase [Nocardia sp. NPDC004168]|uniref:Rv2629 family ribosome hibernation factor n=1 Tax=Nocardia sp. NPDC004168 TaxID=3154452 RepID=UPI0033B560CC
MYGTNLREIAQRRGPFVSLCVDASHNTEDAEQQKALRWRSIRERLAAQHVPEKTLTLLDDAISKVKAEKGRAGRLLIADSDSVLVDHMLAEPPARETVRVSALPYLLPLIEQQSREVPHVIAVVDRVGCDLYGVDEDENLIEMTAEGTAHPVHKIHHGGGWAHLSMQRRVEEVVRRNVGEAATAVRDLADRVGAQVIVLVGEVGARAALAKALDSPTARIVEVEAGARAAGADSAALEAQVPQAVRTQARQHQGQVVEQLNTARGRADGLAVEGLPETVSALLAANADTLLIDPDTVGDRSVELDPELLRGITAAQWIDDATSSRAYRADEALPVVTLLQGGSIVPVEGAVVPREGVATLLRHR